MAIEIVDIPIKSMVIFHAYVKLPEGTKQLEISTFVRYLRLAMVHVYIAVIEWVL